MLVPGGRFVASVNHPMRWPMPDSPDPDDLTVVGFDGIALGEELTPALSTVVQPNRDIGRHGVELLLRALATGEAPTAAASLTLPHAFREGESCGVARSGVP